jgi:hypothetical protein
MSQRSLLSSYVVRRFRAILFTKRPKHTEKLNVRMSLSVISVGVDIYGSHSRRSSPTSSFFHSVEKNHAKENSKCDRFTFCFRSSIHSIPIAVAFGVIAVLLGLYGFVYAIDSILPTPLSLVDEVGKFGTYNCKKINILIRS